MATYKINSMHDIYIDDYIKGELENVNYYTMEGIINANSPKDAIKQYFDEILGYKFKIEYADIVNKNILHYSNLVDENSLEATEEEINQWEKSTKKLYSNNTTLRIYELVQVEI